MISAMAEPEEPEDLAEPEHLDVLVIGAGLSGIGAAHHLQTDCPWASYAIVEARDSIGGTWDLFRYPGIRSDSDMFTLGYPFRPWTGEKAIADGASIREYVVSTAREAGIDRKIRFGHRVLGAAWSTDAARWTVTGERTDTGERFEITCDFLYSCSGYYRYDRGYLPDFEGMDRFEGPIVHPQFWPEDLDYSGQRVVVIGSGATAVTLVPAMTDRAAHVTMLQRSPSYIVSMPGTNPAANFLRRHLPQRIAGSILRWTNALFTQGTFWLSHRWPDAVKRVMRKGVESQLPAGYDIDTHFTPTYNPWDQRVCLVPDGDLFAAIRHGDASVVTDHIETFTEHGIRLRSGAELEADIIVTATGLEVLFLGGIEVSVDGTTVDLSQRMTYKGMMLEGVPNLAFAIGYTNASWTLKADLTSEYVVRLLNHLRARGLRQCTAVNQGTTHDSSSIFSLSSGYLTRAIDRLPKQGSAFPWRVKHSYLADYRAMRLRGVTDDVMVFSNPVAGRRTVGASAMKEAV
jgi:cation diffusion facilitator CzcD-associated flavoprotein CzcO